MKKHGYIAFIVWSRDEKHAVLSSRIKAQELIDKHVFGEQMFITSHFYESKRDLENVIEDDLTDNQANEFLNK